MKISGILILFVLALVLLCSTVSAIAPIAVTPSNTSAIQLGGAYNPYLFASGDDTFEVFTLLPITSQDIVYPLAFYYFIMILSACFLFAGVMLVSKKDHTPSLSVLACGILAFGGFLIAAFMTPYTADLYVHTQVIPHIGTNGASLTNNTIYVIQTADYRASWQMTYILWGLSVAGFIEAILGTLSFIGWFHRKGIKDASNGKYIETDIEDDGSYKKRL